MMVAEISASKTQRAEQGHRSQHPYAHRPGTGRNQAHEWPSEDHPRNRAALLQVSPHSKFRKPQTRAPRQRVTQPANQPGYQQDQAQASPQPCLPCPPFDAQQ